MENTVFSPSLNISRFWTQFSYFSPRNIWMNHYSLTFAFQNKHFALISLSLLVNAPHPHKTHMSHVCSSCFHTLILALHSKHFHHFPFPVSCVMHISTNTFRLLVEQLLSAYNLTCPWHTTVQKCWSMHFPKTHAQVSRHK